jgi:hypothetical protein
MLDTSSEKDTGYPLHSPTSPPVRHRVPSHFNRSLPSGSIYEPLHFPHIVCISYDKQIAFVSLHTINRMIFVLETVQGAAEIYCSTCTTSTDITLVNFQLDAQNSLFIYLYIVHLLKSSTCFAAHLQEV